NQLLRVEIIKSSGSTSKLANKKKEIQTPLLSLVAFQGDGPTSGAYVFRPDSNKTYPMAGNASSTNLMPAVTIVNLQTNNGATASRTSVPPCGVQDRRLGHDRKGNEVIVRFDTGESIASDATLYTDSNGLEFMKRIRNHRDTWNLTLHDNTEAVAANYFRSRLADCVQGAVSLVDGQVEVMVHQCLRVDDYKGVAEFLNET
ncbi:Lysosomal alpha-mannosidase, partial [Phytophthora megakarya]